MLLLKLINFNKVYFFPCWSHFLNHKQKIKEFYINIVERNEDDLKYLNSVGFEIFLLIGRHAKRKKSIKWLKHTILVAKLKHAIDRKLSNPQS